MTETSPTMVPSAIPLGVIDDIPPPPPRTDDELLESTQERESKTPESEAENEIDWDSMDDAERRKMLEYKDLFEYFDEDGSGAIDQYEVLNLDIPDGRRPTIAPMHSTYFVWCFVGAALDPETLTRCRNAAVGSCDAAAWPGPLRRGDPDVYEPGKYLYQREAKHPKVDRPSSSPLHS